MNGFYLDGVIERVTDGDTLRIMVDGTLFKVRVLGLDTEESNPNDAKPVTPWGRAATAFATSILPVDTPVTIEFAGTAPALLRDAQGDTIINPNYLDNHDRPLGYVHLSQPVDGITDFSELMIRKGYSPYFVKYGRSIFADYDARYAVAEQAAQRDHIGVWNQFAVNGVMNPNTAPRNYAQLMVWWELRARLIDDFRAARAVAPPGTLLNTRIDYTTLVEKAMVGETATVFMELTQGETRGIHYTIKTGSRSQPFQVFLPNADDPKIRAVLNLLRARYVADGEDFPRRNYAYVQGPLKMFKGRPEIVVTEASQISDTPPV